MESKFIINLGRELGSGGSVIGRRVAERVSIEFYDRSLLKIAARQSGISAEIFQSVDELNKKSFLATLVSYLKSPFAVSEAASDSVLSGETLFKIQSDVIRELASRGSALFVGRCADYILRDHPLSINIFITADACDRVKRIMELHSLSESEAKNAIEECDRRRADYYNFYGNGRWGYAASYDLCVNSSLLGVDQTVDFIVKFVEARLAHNVL